MTENHLPGPLAASDQDSTPDSGETAQKMPEHNPHDAVQDSDYELVEPRADMPFGEGGVAFLRNLLQHAVFLGIVVLTIMIVQNFRPLMGMFIP